MKEICGYQRQDKPYALSKTGQNKLEQAHLSLQEIVLELLHYKDITITCTVRTKEEQEEAFRKGNSKARYGQSAHNFNPSRAIDIVPYPIPMKGNQWDNNSKEWDDVAELFLTIAKDKGIDITWGGNFKSIVDKPHFELTGWKSM